MSKLKIVALFLSLAALMAPGLASAADVFTIYAYGSGDSLYSIFNGMKLMVDNRGYRMLIFTLLLLSMIFLLVRGFIFEKPSAGPFVTIVGGAFILNILIFAPAGRTSLHIQDEVNATDFIVDDMPLALAGAAALSSEMSRYFVIVIESFYATSIPQELMVSKNNTYNMANKIIAGLKNVKVTEPLTRASFNEYIKSCVVPDMYEGKIRIKDVLNAGPDDFWKAIRSTNRARMTLCFAPCDEDADGSLGCTNNPCPPPITDPGYQAKDWRAGVMVACAADGGADAHSALETRIRSIILANPFADVGSGLLTNTTLMDGIVSSSVALAGGLSGTSGTESYVRAGLMNMFRESTSSVIASGGAPGLISVMAQEQARAQQKSNWIIAAGVFADAVAYLWATLQTFIFAIFPIAIVLFCFPGLGGKAIAGYFGLLAWTALWTPFLAIINYMSMSWLQTNIGLLQLPPMSYGALVPMSEAAENMQAVTSFLGTMVPILTYGMVRGGEFAMTQFIQDASAPGASQAAAGQMASKSYTYGSIAANNVGANKFDTTMTSAQGYKAVDSTSGIGSFNQTTQLGGSGVEHWGNRVATTVTQSQSASNDQSAGNDSALKQSVSVDTSSQQSLSNFASVGARSGLADNNSVSAARAAAQTYDQVSSYQTGVANDYSQKLQSVFADSSKFDAKAGLGFKGGAATALLSAQLTSRGVNNVADGFQSSGGGSIAAGAIQSTGGMGRELFTDEHGNLVSNDVARQRLEAIKQDRDRMAAKGMTDSQIQDAYQAAGFMGQSDNTLRQLKLSDAQIQSVRQAENRVKVGGVELDKGALQVTGGSLGMILGGAWALGNVVPGLTNVLDKNLDVKTGTEVTRGGSAEVRDTASVDQDSKEDASYRSGLSAQLRTEESAQRVRQATQGVEAALGAQGNNTDNFAVAKKDDHTYSVTVGEKSTRGSSAQAATPVYEPVSVDEYRRMRDEVGANPLSGGGNAFAAQAVDATRDGQAAAARIDHARGASADGRAHLDGQYDANSNAAGRPVEMPSPALMGGNPLGRTQSTAAAIGGAGGGKLDAGPVAGVASFGGVGHERQAIAKPMQVQSSLRGEELNQFRAGMQRAGEDLTNTATNWTIPIGKISDAAIKGAFVMTPGIQNAMQANKALQGTLDQTTGGRYAAETMVNPNTGTFSYQITDRQSGVGMEFVPTADGFAPANTRENREAVGAFMQTPSGAMLLGVPKDAPVHDWKSYNAAVKQGS